MYTIEIKDKETNKILSLIEGKKYEDGTCVLVDVYCPKNRINISYVLYDTFIRYIELLKIVSNLEINISEIND